MYIFIASWPRSNKVVKARFQCLDNYITHHACMSQQNEDRTGRVVDETRKTTRLYVASIFVCRERIRAPLIAKKKALGNRIELVRTISSTKYEY